MKLDDINLLDVGNTIHMVGALYADGTKLYLCPFPDSAGRLLGDIHFAYASGGRAIKVDVLDMTPDDWTAFLRQTDILELPVTTEGPDGKIVKAIARKSQRQIAQTISWEVFRRDHYTCRYCGRDDIPLTVDHLVLWEDCGPSIPENLVAACRKCNKKRGNTPYAEWLQSEHYTRVSEKLTNATRQDNLALITTLDGIPRMPHKPSKRR